MAASALDSGAAFEKFEQMVVAQRGQPSAALKVANSEEVSAQQAGFVSAIDTEQLGMAVIAMGGGRQKVSDAIDHSVGLEMLVRIGDEVQIGQPLVRLFCPKPGVYAENIRKTISIGEEANRPDLVADRITA